MKISGLQKLTLIDFPHHLACCVFVKDCNFHCPYCFNKDLVLGNLPTISQQSILSFLKKRKKFLDGVVITGGEPTLQPDLEAFIKKVKRLGFKIKLDTNGALPIILKNLLKKDLLDYVALDVKAPLDENYIKAIGREDFDPPAIIEAIKLLIRSKAPSELRTTVVPGIHDKKILVKMARQLKKIIGRRKIPWFWQNFQPKTCLDSEFEKIKPFSKIELERLLKTVKKIIPEAKLRTS